MRKLLPAASLIALSCAAAAPASAAADSATSPASPWDDVISQTVTRTDREPTLAFPDMGQLPPISPKLADGTMMVPARALLEGLGYRLEWDPALSGLTALRDGGPALTFRSGQPVLAVGEGGAVELPVPPYMDGEQLWIPLRAAAESSGLAVEWNEASRTAVVRDPNAPLRFSVATRADNGVLQPSAGLAAYMKNDWKADIRFSLLPPDYYNEKVNLMIAAGDPADLMLIGKPHQFQEELFRSFATDLTGLLADFPRLKALAESGSPSARTIDGRIYGIPRPADKHDAPFPAVRQDWLNKLGLTAPATMDELYEVLVRFVKDDPDGNGKHDTIGLSGVPAGDGLGTLQWVEQAFTGYPYRFAREDGRVVDTAVGADERVALQWLAKAYAAGLVDKEFPVLDDRLELDRLKSGTVGMTALRPEQAAGLTSEGGFSAGKPQWAPLPALNKGGSSEKIAPWDTDGAGLYIIPRTVPRDKAIRLLEWLDRGLAMSETNRWSEVPDLSGDDRLVIDSLFGRSPLAGPEPVERLPEPLRARYEQAAESWEAIDYAEAFTPAAETMTAKGDYAEMNRTMEQMKIKVILGLPIEQWDRYVDELQSSAPYRAMMAELNAAATGEPE